MDDRGWAAGTTVGEPGRDPVTPMSAFRGHDDREPCACCEGSLFGAAFGTADVEALAGDEPRVTARGKDFRRWEVQSHGGWRATSRKGGDPVTNLYDCTKGLHA